MINILNILAYFCVFSVALFLSVLLSNAALQTQFTKKNIFVLVLLLALGAASFLCAEYFKNEIFYFVQERALDKKYEGSKWFNTQEIDNLKEQSLYFRAKEYSLKANDKINIELFSNGIGDFSVLDLQFSYDPRYIKFTKVIRGGNAFSNQSFTPVVGVVKHEPTRDVVIASYAMPFDLSHYIRAGELLIIEFETLNRLGNSQIEVTTANLFHKLGAPSIPLNIDYAKANIKVR